MTKETWAKLEYLAIPYSVIEKEMLVISDGLSDYNAMKQRVDVIITHVHVYENKEGTYDHYEYINLLSTLIDARIRLLAYESAKFSEWYHSDEDNKLSFEDAFYIHKNNIEIIGREISLLKQLKTRKEAAHKRSIK